MKIFTKIIAIGTLWLVYSLTSGCSLLFPANTTMTNYQLTGVNTKKLTKSASRRSLLVSQPTAAAGYKDNAMQYRQQHYQIATFAKNQWLAPPAEMLQPLLIQSIRNSGYFYAVVGAPIAAVTDLRLDSELVKLQQNFTTHPSEVELVIQAVLVNASTNTVLASRSFTVQVAAPSDDPYGGVVAANWACQTIMQQMAAFVVKASQR